MPNWLMWIIDPIEAHFRRSSTPMPRRSSHPPNGVLRLSEEPFPGPPPPPPSSKPMWDVDPEDYEVALDDRAPQRFRRTIGNSSNAKLQNSKRRGRRS